MTEKRHEVADETLIKEFQEGNKEAFTELVKKNKEKAVQIAYLTTRDYEDAKEIAQDAFVKVHRKLHEFRFEAKFSTWFYRILINTSKDYMRKKRWSRLHILPAKDDSRDPMEQIEDKGISPKQSAIGSELSVEMNKTLQDLPEKQRWVFTLRYIEGMSLEEIGKCTGMAEGTVKSSLYFAVQKFKKGMQPYLKEGGSHHGL